MDQDGFRLMRYSERQKRILLGALNRDGWLISGGGSPWSTREIITLAKRGLFEKVENNGLEETTCWRLSLVGVRKAKELKSVVA